VYPPLARIATAFAVLAILLAAAPDAGEAAKRKVPRNFVGVVWDGPIRAAPEDLQAAQFPRMAAAGVETVRIAFHWAEAQPQENGPIDLSETDRLVGLAAARRIHVQPHVILAPVWARAEPYALAPPLEPEMFRQYVLALVARYGSAGTFWTEHPELPRLPIRDWQFWNEPHMWSMWSIPEWAEWSTSYLDHLKVFHATVKAADPRAKVVLAGLSNASWKYLRKLYKAGAKRYFDIATVHPYTRHARGVPEIVRRFRAVMRKNGDGRLPLWVTELGLPASEGRIKSKSALQTTDRGMAGFLRQSYLKLARKLRRPAFGATRVYWYTWASEYEGSVFRYAGLFRYRGSGAPRKRPAFRALVKTARRLEGCRKTVSGRCR
jgi:hypothetical protein